MKVRRLYKLEGDGPSRTVLVVDDDPKDRWAMRAVIEADPRIETIKEAATAEEAVAAAAAEPVGVFVVDHALAGVEGLDLATRLREKSPDGRIIMCTALDIGARADQNPTVDAFVSKHQLERLLPTVQLLLRLPVDRPRPGEKR
jgi:two-component system response regulator AlgR